MTSTAVTVVSIGPADRAAAARWMQRFDIGDPLIPHPVPEVPARLALPGEAPPVATTLAEQARRGGWSASVVYARGTAMDARGRAGVLIDSISVRCWRFPGQRAVALWYSRAGKCAWGAEAGWLWTMPGPPVPVGVAMVKAEIALTAPAAPVVPASTRRVCLTCAKSVTVNADNTLRAHGPKAARCPGEKIITG